MGTEVKLGGDGVVQRSHRKVVGSITCPLVLSKFHGLELIL